MMLKKYIYNLFLLGLLVTGSVVNAQTIKGNVSDLTGPLPMVNIVVKGTAINTATDFDGNYSLSKVDSDAILVFSYIGFQTLEMPVAGKTNISVILKEDINTLNEVLIVGYTSEKKSAITGAVSTVDMGEMSKTKVADVGQALQGQVAGVFVSANTGAPGDGMKIRIRGEGTLGNNDVLYVVDGVATRDISFLNQADVKSMTVLKDAAAGAIYGSRASAGVIVITTKNGSKGKTSINAEYYSGISYATNLPKLLNTDQYLTAKDQAWHNTAGNAANAISPYAADRNRTDLANTDWLKQLFSAGLTTNFQLSANGGTETTQYLISGGYFAQNGIVIGDHDKFQRINFRVNLNSDITPNFKIGTNIQLTNTVQDKLSSSGDAPGVIRHAFLRPPVLSVYKNQNDPGYSERDPYTDLPFYQNNNSNGGWDKKYEQTMNPIALVHFTDDKVKTFRTFGNIYGEYKFLADKSLKFRSSFGADLVFNHNKAFAENFGDDEGDLLYPTLGRLNKPSSLNENRGQTMTFTFTNTLNYVKTINEKHTVNALLGTESISSKYSWIGGSRENYDNTTNPFRYLDYGGMNKMMATGTDVNWNLVSFFGSGTYGYDNKYYVSGTIRADGSSRFGPNNKWGYFPSVSGGWILSKEKFLENSEWLSNLKLRASWGQSGNQEIPNNAYLTVVTKRDEALNITYGNPNIKWETTTQTDIGIDISVLKNKLSFTADYFDKTTDDILLGVSLPVAAAGITGLTYINAGTVSNKGFEFGANFQNNDRAFKYGISGNVATLTNKVEKLHESVANIDDILSNTRTTVGKPINSYYGYKSDGIYQNTAEVNSNLYTNSNGTQPGDIKFKDVDGDGQITENDRTFIGNPIPKITYGLSFNAEYQRLDISFLFQGVQDVDRYNELKKIVNYDSRPFNSTTDVLNSWHGEGTSNTTPRLTFNDNGGSKVSSTYIEDASYLRLKNIEIGYTFNPQTLGDANLRMYLSGQNLFTITKYSGLDPESTSLIDKGTYPQSMTFILGLKLKL
ncbi:SusC/RagA family TonB-linked outer membrane protein [Flavobacterium sp. N1736]|uniref:SusC/RagA family TonB-linked outer membrane protein n=1 Tax=Flavobacterium sp. N1736 TaxID=2986823 RepID=UPI002225824D|nr:TonB-dependent receptor [Flavobacterium sp. N1736]